MLKMDIEFDPLKFKDPLDSTSDILNNVEGLPSWVTHLKPEIVNETISKDILSKHSTEKPAENRLRIRKSQNIFTNRDRKSNENWQSKIQSTKRTKILRSKKKLQKTRKRITSENKTDTNENVISTAESTKKIFRNKYRRENYLKKYKLMKEKRSYICDLCKKNFITASHLKEHFLSHSQCFPCKECGKVFNYLRSLQRHVAAGHDPKLLGLGVEGEKDKQYSPSLKTDNLEEKYDRCKKYYQQLKAERKYQCEVCRKTFITSGHLNSHMYCHSERKWKCDGCGKNFSCERSLARHKDTFPGEHWFPCQLCDMTFFRVINFAKHMEIKHPEVLIDEKRALILNLPLKSNSLDSSNCSDSTLEVNGKKLYVCAECLKIFYSSENLKIHKQAMHTLKEFKNEKSSEENNLFSFKDVMPNYKCEMCSKGFISLEGFEYHKNNQHSVKIEKKKRKKIDAFEKGENEECEKPCIPNFICKICSSSFYIKSELQAHLKSHNVSKNIEVKTGCHQCCICPRSFASSDGLKYHLATHTGERRYSCGQCGKKFIKKTHLSEHIATHSEIKYFKCLRCPRTFSTHSAYKKHIKHFPGPHSFPCTKCGKLFTKESMIEKHMCVDLVNITMAPEIKALLSEDMIEEYLCLAEEQATKELERRECKNTNDCIGETDEKESFIVESNNLKSYSEQNSTSHSCYKCFKVFPNLDSLQSHHFEHIGKQNYHCRFCSQSFKRADAFGTHIRDHLGSTPYMCLKCNRKFISPLTLSMHVKNYPGDHSFTCKKCQRWFPSERRLEKHECILESSDSFICACSIIFKSWNELLYHAGPKPYKCCSCVQKYPTLTALARHLKKHTGAKPFSCEVCGKSFRTRSNYLLHLNTHKNIKEIQCEHCEFKSKSQKRMDYHLFRKHKIEINTFNSSLCPICGIIFPYMSQMKKHVEAEHGNAFMGEKSKDEKKGMSVVLCTLCGKLLNNKYTLANHMKKVHDPNGTKSEQESKCEVCGEKFRSTNRLQRHAEVHEPPGLRICDICNKEFYFSKDLRKHMKKHDTNKPYTCLRCGKNFKVSVSLKYHSSICGNIKDPKNEKEIIKEENFSNTNMFYGHMEPLDLNSRSYTLVYRK